MSTNDNEKREANSLHVAVSIVLIMRYICLLQIMSVSILHINF